MKFRVGDQVIVTAGKEKGKQGKIVRVLPEKNRVVVENINLYAKHIKPMGERAGEKIKRERALPTANVAILNDQGVADRVGYKVAKDGTKERFYKKTGKTITVASDKKKTTKK